MKKSIPKISYSYSPKPNDAPEDYEEVNPEFGQKVKVIIDDLSNNLIYTFDRNKS